MATGQEGNVSFKQVRAAHRHGDGTQAQASDGTGTSGNFPKFAADGTLTDSGVAAAAVGSIVIGFIINTGATGTNIAPIAIAPRAGTVSKCKIVTKTSDGTTALAFTIKQNGVSVFSTPPTVAAGTAPGTITTSTSLTSSPLSVTADDLFTIDITSGSSSWSFTAQLET